VSSSGSASSAGGKDAGKDSSPQPPDAMAVSACQMALKQIQFTFDSSDEGFTSEVLDSPSGSWPYDPWGHGSAQNGFPCKKGNCYGADLVRNYAQCQRAALVSPTVDLSACKTEPSVKLNFSHAYDFARFSYGGTAYADGGVVEFSGDDGATWRLAATSATTGTVKINPDRGSSYACVKSTQFSVNNKAGFVGSSLSYTQVAIDVPAAVRTNSFRFRFAMGSGVSSRTTSADSSRASTGKGWRIDEISFGP
jgi:hypothetical protein